MLATVQSLGNLAASAIAGLLWTLVSPAAALLYAAAWMLVALAAFVAIRGGRAGFVTMACRAHRHARIRKRL
jgi:hypothetical protein